MHFKNTREAAVAIKLMELNKAKAYLEAVKKHQRVIPFHRFCGGVGRTAQAKNERSTTGQGRWPVKSVEILLGLLKNAESNAEVRPSWPRNHTMRGERPFFVSFKQALEQRPATLQMGLLARRC